MSAVGGLCCCVGAATLYALGISLKGDAEQLECVTRVSRLSDLAQLWDAARPVYPLVVAVSGRVRSDTPIQCQCSDLKCVLVEKTEESHILKRDDKGKWKEESSFLSSKWAEVPWYLDDGTSHARVRGARWASGLSLKYGGDVFERSIKSAREEILEIENGLKTRGVKKIERVLPIGSYLTVVGEAIRDGTGTFSIEKPSRGGPFYVSSKTLGQLIEDLQSESSICKYASVALAVVGGCLIVTDAFQSTK